MSRASAPQQWRGSAFTRLEGRGDPLPSWLCLRDLEPALLLHSGSSLFLHPSLPIRTTHHAGPRSPVTSSGHLHSSLPLPHVQAADVPAPSLRSRILACFLSSLACSDSFTLGGSFPGTVSQPFQAKSPSQSRSCAGSIYVAPKGPERAWCLAEAPSMPVKSNQIHPGFRRNSET